MNANELNLNNLTPVELDELIAKYYKKDINKKKRDKDKKTISTMD